MTTVITPHPRSGKPMAVIKKWRRLDINSPPDASGVYAIKSGKRWLYIGRSVSIGTRIKMPYHPIRITRCLKSISLSYWWHPVDRAILPRTESYLIGKFEPEWNGGTSFDHLNDPPYPCCANILPLSAKEWDRINQARNVLFVLQAA